MRFNTKIFILIHPNLGLHPILTQTDEISTNTTNNKLDKPIVGFLQLPTPLLDFPCQPPVGLSTSPCHSTTPGPGLEITHTTMTPTQSWEKQTKYSSPIKVGLTHKVIQFLEGKALTIKSPQFLARNLHLLLNVPLPKTLLTLEK